MDHKIVYFFNELNELKAEECLLKLKQIVKNYGYATVADLKDLCEKTSTYTDTTYGWTDLSDARVFGIHDFRGRKIYGFDLPGVIPVPGPKSCTDERVTENRYGHTCPNCQSLNIREISSYHDAGDTYQMVGFECTDCHTTFTVDEFDVPEDEIDLFYCGSRNGGNLGVVLKENNRLRRDLEEAKKLLTLAEFYMCSGQDMHSIYPCWTQSYHKTVNDIREFIRKTK